MFAISSSKQSFPSFFIFHHLVMACQPSDADQRIKKVIIDIFSKIYEFFRAFRNQSKEVNSKHIAFITFLTLIALLAISILRTKSARLPPKPPKNP